MSERKEYWAKVVSEEALLFLCSQNICTRELPIMKVYDIGRNEVMIVEILGCAIPQQIKYKFLGSSISKLSLNEALSLDIKDKKRAEILEDCLVNENEKDYSNKSNFIFRGAIKGKWSDDIKGLKNNPAFDERCSLLPDEIDLYNFFEKYKGHAKCFHIFGHVVCCYTLNGYITGYKESDKIEYFIDDNRYYAIKFKDRGVFLVSERRYQELKARHNAARV